MRLHERCHQLGNASCRLEGKVFFSQLWLNMKSPCKTPHVDPSNLGSQAILVELIIASKELAHYLL